MAQTALAWLLHQPQVTSVIIGAKNLEQLDDNLASAELALSDRELDALHSVTEPPAQYPGWMVSRQNQGRSVD